MEKFLFIGNSHTYYNDMPDIFRRICKWNGKDVFCVMLAHGGVGLDYHVGEPEAAHNITFGGYDRVVIQHRANPFCEDSFFEAGRELVRLTKKGGSKGLVYMAWPKLSDRDTQGVATDACLRFCRESGFDFCPAGEAWWEFLDAHPEIEMFRKDGMHASKKGSYLAACCIYSAAYGERAKTDGDPIHEKMAQLAFDTYQRFSECL